MSTSPAPQKYAVVKRVCMKDKNENLLGILQVGTILHVIDKTRARRKSIKSAEMGRVEVIQANEKKIHGFCYTHDFRGNVLIEEVGNSNEEKLDSKEEEIIPSLVLARVQVLAENINKEQLEELVSGLEERFFKQGEVIMKEGHEGTDLFIFKRGRAQISDKDQKLGTLVPGDYYGEQSLNNVEKSFEWVHTVTAITDVLCLVASQKMVKAVLNTEHLVPLKERAAFSTKRPKRPTVDEGTAVNPQGVQIQFIKKAVEDTTLFSGLNDQERLAVIVKMRLEIVQPLHEIIKQGETNGVKFYVVKKGAFEVSIDGKSRDQYERGQCFGERALIQDAPRAATIQSLQPSEVWVLHRDDYRFTIREEATKIRKRLLYFIKLVPAFKDFPQNDLVALAEAFEEKKYKDGEPIINQGDKGDRFYVIMHGVARFIKKDKRGRITAQGKLTESKYFGELALTTGEARAASVTAHSDLTCLELSKVDFDNLLKPLGKIFERKAKTYMAITQKTYRRISSLERGEESKKDDVVEDDILLKVSTPLKGLKKIGLLGKGAFGLVTLVEDPATKKKFALKAIRKHDIVEHGQVEHVVNEKNIQCSLKTPFCVKLYRTYKDDFRIYFLLEACTGGDIFTFLRKKRTFNEHATRFYAACIIAAFDHMHNKKIIYRDLKPENLVMDHTGYCKLTDFGFAKIVEDKTSTVCGTPDYLAPEVIVGRGHNKGVDFWTLGIFIYECINGVAPFYSKKDMDIYRKILRAPVKYTKRMSVETRELVSKLLRKKAAKRLGVRKGEVIHEQPFFVKSNWSWEKFLQLEVNAPYPPKKVGFEGPKIPRYRLFDKDIPCPSQDFEKEF